MDFRLTDEQLEFQQKCRRFATEVIRPVAAKHDREQSVPWEVIKEAQKWNLAGLDLVQEMGMDEGGLKGVIYAEELHYGCAGIALAISASGLAAAGIAASGTPEQIGRWVPECYGSGDTVKLGAYAVTEAGAGSDVKSLRTTAKRDGDEWVLNGTKVFITNGSVADVFVIVATVDPELGHRGQASFIIHKDDGGIRGGKKEKKLGIRASDTSEVILEDCRIPADRVLGGLDKLEQKLEKARKGESSGRTSAALRTFELTRPIVAIQAVGIARAALEFAIDYAKERKTFGVPIAQHQSIQNTLADMATEVECSRLITHYASWLGASGQPFNKAEGSMSKLKASETCVSVTEKAVQVLGGYGYIKDFPVEKYYRDSKIYTLFEGTSEIQRMVIARALTT